MRSIMDGILLGKSSIIVDCESPVARDSLDHIHPWGTKRDNSRNWFFNKKLYRLFEPEKTLAILDLGCAGGGFVKDCLDDGHFALGLEGSDYSKLRKRAEWATIPRFLFTCDISRRFDIYIADDEAKKRDRVLFEVVTSWDVLEHLDQESIRVLAGNVSNHLSASGLWIASIASKDDVVNGVNLHKTVMPKQAWIRMFEGLGFFNREEYVKYFNTQFIRGPKYSAPQSFHLCLSKSADGLPNIPRQNALQRASDIWFGSKLQKFLRFAVTGER